MLYEVITPLEVTKVVSNPMATTLGFTAPSAAGPSELNEAQAPV